jgi:threonine/homoserine/homoserine lactone efflux protein
MLDLSTILSLAIAMALFGASPGPGIFAVVGRALNVGFANAMLLTFGLILGDLVWLTLAVSGLSVVAEMMGEFFVALKVIGGLYLAWMGIKAWRAPADPAALGGTVVRPKAAGTLAGGLAVTLSNPKAILFYMAILPTVLDLDSITAGGLVVAGAVVTVVLAMVCGVYAFLASRARQMLQSPRAMKRLNRASGALLVGVGAWVASR